MDADTVTHKKALIQPKRMANHPRWVAKVSWPDPFGSRLVLSPAVALFLRKNRATKLMIDFITRKLRMMKPMIWCGVDMFLVCSG